MIFARRMYLRDEIFSSIQYLHLPEQMYLDILQDVGHCDTTILFKTGHCRKGMSHNVIYCWSKLVKS